MSGIQRRLMDVEPQLNHREARALFFALADEELPVQGPWQFDDCGWVANRWCDLLPLPTAVKQRLLELESPLLRLELVADALDQLRNGPEV